MSMHSLSIEKTTKGEVNEKLFFGWNFLWQSIENQISKKSDVLIALTHFFLIKWARFRCLGIGEDKTISKDELRSELLPPQWNCMLAGKFALRYARDGKLFILFGHTFEENFLMNLLEVKTLELSNITFKLSETVLALQGGLNELFQNAAEILGALHEELLEPIIADFTKQVSTQTTQSPFVLPRSSQAVQGMRRRQHYNVLADVRNMRDRAGRGGDSFRSNAEALQHGIVSRIHESLNDN